MKVFKELGLVFFSLGPDGSGALWGELFLSGGAALGGDFGGPSAAAPRSRKVCLCPCGRSHVG